MSIIETPRLIVRPLERADVSALVAMWSDGKITRYIGGPRDGKEVERSLETKISSGQTDLDLWPVVEKATGELVGHCGLLRKYVDGQSEIELVYVIMKKAWGRGYATEVAAAIRDHALGQLGCGRLIALINPANVASERVAVKIGLRYEKDTVRPNGMSLRVYALNKADLTRR